MIYHQLPPQGNQPGNEYLSHIQGGSLRHWPAWVHGFVPVHQRVEQAGELPDNRDSLLQTIINQQSNVRNIENSVD